MSAGAQGISFADLVEELLHGATLQRTVSLQEQT
jgi:hypothetical protein